MKKFKISILLSIIAIVAGIIAMNSCSKQETEVKQNEPCVTQADKAFVSKIVNFKQKVDYIRENPHYKSGESMEVDSVVWYFEALFNAKYAFTDEQYIKTKTKTDSLSIGINLNNNVDMDDIANAYDEFLTKVKSMYNQSTLNNKELILLDLEISRTGISEAVVNIRPVFGEKGVLTINYDPFDVDDYWYYGEWLGDCDFNYAGETDAAQKISGAIMAHRPIYLPCPGCYYTYSDIDTVNLEGYEYQNSNGEYLIFYIVRPDGNFTPDDKCLEPDEMNFHFHGEETVIYEKLEPELNKTFMSCYLEGFQDSDDNNYPRIRHHNKLYFGIMHLVEPGWIIVDKEHLAD